MRYQNRLPPEGINTPVKHPLRDFFELLFWAAIAIVAIGLILNFAGSFLARLVPARYEVAATQQITRALDGAGQPSPFAVDSEDKPGYAYLREVANRVQQVMNADSADAIPLTLHYSDEDVINAYATIGGHVYVYKGLLALLPHENALAMLLAHEFGHVRQRHPAQGVGGGLAVAVGTSFILGSSAFENRFFSITSSLMSMSFSRDMEHEADQVGLAAVHAMYGHVNGADDLFTLFMQQRDSDQSNYMETFFSTHPLDQQRIDFIRSHALDNGWSVDGSVTELPAEFDRWFR